MEPSDIAPPLGQSQHTKSTEKETLALVQTINAELPDLVRLEPDRLLAAFNIWWSKLQKQLEAVPGKPKDEDIPPTRTDDDKINEVLQLLRKLSTDRVPSGRGRVHGTVAASGVGYAPKVVLYRVSGDLQELSTEGRVKLRDEMVGMKGIAALSSSEDGRLLNVDVFADSDQDATEKTNRIGNVFLKFDSPFGIEVLTDL